MPEAGCCGTECQGCIYLGTFGGDPSCDYLLWTGKSRLAMGVKTGPGGGCRLKKCGEKPKPGALPISFHRTQEKKAPEKKEPKADGRKMRKSRLDCTEAMALYESGATDREIAKKFGITPCPVRKWREKHGLEANYRKRGSQTRRITPPGRSKLDCPEAMALYRGGATDCEIAKAMGVSGGAVYNWRVRRGYPPNRRRDREEGK